jgi:hypothetical protein
LPNHDKRKIQFNNLVSFLTIENLKNTIDCTCDFLKLPEYKKGLYQSFAQSYSTLCILFKDEEFPIEKKIEIVQRYESERHQCVSGLAGLLQDICTSVDEPAEVGQKLSWLVARYKTEIIKAVIVEVHHTNQFIANYGEKARLAPLCY